MCVSVCVCERAVHADLKVDAGFKLKIMMRKSIKFFKSMISTLKSQIGLL